MPLEWIPRLAAYRRGARAAISLHPVRLPVGGCDGAVRAGLQDRLLRDDEHPLLQHVARKGKPLIVSTGTADLDEVREMIAAVRAVADPGTVVLQCTAKYPAPLAALNVRAVAGMARARRAHRALRPFARAAAGAAGRGGAGRRGDRKALHALEHLAGAGPCVRAGAGGAQRPDCQAPAARGFPRVGGEGRPAGGARAARLRAAHHLHHPRRRQGRAPAPV